MERQQLIDDSIAMVEEATALEQQIQAAREDSIAMAAAKKGFGAPVYSAYYVVVGSFLDKVNADAFLADMQGVFSQTEILKYNNWNMVCVGGKLASFGAADRKLVEVKKALQERDKAAAAKAPEDVENDLPWILGVK